MSYGNYYSHGGYGYGNSYHANAGWYGEYAGKGRQPRSYIVCECGKWIYKDRKIEFCQCGRSLLHQRQRVPQQADFPPLQGASLQGARPGTGSGVSAALAALGEDPVLGQLAPLVKNILDAAGIQCEGLDSSQPKAEVKPILHADKLKQSLAKKKGALEQAQKLERQKNQKQAQIDRLQAQIDQASKELIGIENELDEKRKLVTESDAAHDALLAEGSEQIDESEDFPMDDDPDQSVSNDPAVIASKRSYLQALAGAKRRRAEAQSSSDAPPLEEKGGLMSDATMAAAASAAEASGEAPPGQGAGQPDSSAAHTLLQQVAEEVRKAAPKTNGTARDGPYNK